MSVVLRYVYVEVSCYEARFYGFITMYYFLELSRVFHLIMKQFLLGGGKLPKGVFSHGGGFQCASMNCSHQ